ncbi:hypothetical protein OAT18_03915 [Tenacibaculum sp.]|nr:hypothetical protein [Tenacibaculum sp.]
MKTSKQLSTILLLITIFFAYSFTSLDKKNIFEEVGPNIRKVELNVTYSPYTNDCIRYQIASFASNLLNQIYGGRISKKTVCSNNQNIETWFIDIPSAGKLPLGQNGPSGAQVDELTGEDDIIGGSGPLSVLLMDKIEERYCSSYVLDIDAGPECN